jgi:hypothetical protein
MGFQIVSSLISIPLIVITIISLCMHGRYVDSDYFKPADERNWDSECQWISKFHLKFI